MPRQLAVNEALATVSEPSTSDYVRTAPPSAAAAQARFTRDSQKDAAQKNIEDRDRIEAQRAGVPLEVWHDLPIESRERIIRMKADGRPAVAQDTPLVDLSGYGNDGSVMTPQEFEQVSSQRMDVDPVFYRDKKGRELYTYMCRPPVRMVFAGVEGMYHPEMQLISRVEMDQKLAAGWSIYPIYPFPPEPTVPCPISDALVMGFGGTPCTYRTYTGADVDLHMRTTHPQEYIGLQNSRRQAREEENLSLMRQLLERGITPPVAVD